MEDKTQQTENKTKKQIDGNIIFIGQKDLKDYLRAIFIEMIVKNKSEIKIVARGRFICKAVDVVEVMKRRILKDNKKIAVKNITIGSEQFTKKDEVSNQERTFNVSTIEIPISKV